MKRMNLVTVAVLLAANTLYAEPPKLALKDATRQGSKWIEIRAETSGKNVKFLPGPGLDPFPLTLPDSKVFVAIWDGKAPWVVSAYTSLNDELSDLATITVGGVVPPITPPVTPPISPPETSGLYFMVIRPDGPASPAFTNTMKLTEWQTLVKLGHSVKDKTATEARAFGIPFAHVPCVARLTISADGKSSKLVDVIPLPTTGADILKLPTGIK